MRPLCRHCGQRRSNRPRGLCWSCYYTPGVRAQYPVNGKWSARPDDDDEGFRPLPDVPTAALPGTEDKVVVLSERHQQRQALWHPDDRIVRESDVIPLAFLPEGRPAGHAQRPRRQHRSRSESKKAVLAQQLATILSEQPLSLQELARKLGILCTAEFRTRVYHLAHQQTVIRRVAPGRFARAS